MVQQQGFFLGRSVTEQSVLETIMSRHPDKFISMIREGMISFTAYAAAGLAEMELIEEGENLVRTGQHDQSDKTLPDTIRFSQFRYYTIDDDEVLLYHVQCKDSQPSFSGWNWFILTPRSQTHEDLISPMARRLIQTVGKWCSQLDQEMYVFEDGVWHKSKDLYKAVQQASWEDVPLDKDTKQNLMRDVNDFFANFDILEEYVVPWRRGIIIDGSSSGDKSIRIGPLMKSLQEKDIASLYVRAFTSTQDLEDSIYAIFSQARVMAPCMVVFEDVSSPVIDKVRYYFTCEVGGLEDNNGILVLGCNYHPDSLNQDGRKWRSDNYSKAGRKGYCDFWRGKLQKNKNLQLDDEICEVVAEFTEGFSRAYLRELFVRTLLTAERAQVDPHQKISGEQDIRTSGFPSRAQETDQPEGEISSGQDIPAHLGQNPLVRILHAHILSLSWDVAKGPHSWESGYALVPEDVSPLLYRGPVYSRGPWD